jgi:hypothetical protein
MVVSLLFYMVACIFALPKPNFFLQTNINLVYDEF